MVELPKIAIDLDMPEESNVLRPISTGYVRKSSKDFLDTPATLTPRQALFYRILIQLAQISDDNTIPVDFETKTQGKFHLDRGCIKIAVHAGFLLPLKDDETDKVSRVTLSWDSTGKRKLDV